MPRKQWQELICPDVHLLWQDESNRILKAQIGRKKLCLVRHEGTFYALDARCPHAGGPLTAGFINDQCQIVCPWHRFAFDLKTGNSESGGYFIDSYPIRQEGRRFFVQIKKSWWGLF